MNAVPFLAAATAHGLMEVLEIIEYPNFNFSRILNKHNVPRHFQRFLDIKIKELQKV